MSSTIVRVGHQDGAGLPHRVAALVIEIGAVLDRPHPGLQRRDDAGLAVAVRGHGPLGEPGHFHDRGQLGPGELLMHRMINLGQHPAGRADLDHPGVAPELLADRADAAVRAVGQPQHAFAEGEVLHPGQRVGMQVGVAAGGAQDRAGGIDSRAVEHSLRDYPGEVEAKAAHLAHRRDAGIERGPQVARAAHGPEREWLQRHLAEIEDARAEEMTVAVPHAGHDRRRLVRRRARGIGCGRRRSRVADPDGRPARPRHHGSGRRYPE